MDIETALARIAEELGRIATAQEELVETEHHIRAAWDRNNEINEDNREAARLNKASAAIFERLVRDLAAKEQG